MRVAVGLPQLGTDVDGVVRAAREAEDSGAWGVWVFDNLAGLVRPDAPVLEGWSLLGPLALATARVKLVSLVTRAGLRHPALVARMAAVVQDASQGRFVLGLGAGDAQSRREERRFGIARAGSRAERLHLVEETAERVRHDGLPVRPVTPEPPAVWVGGLADDLLGLAARTADGWHGWEVDSAGFAARATAVRESAGRQIDCWWGGVFDPSTARTTMDALASAGATGVTWMIASRRDGEWRPRLLELVRTYA